jgi:hypothetical protein
MSPFLRTNSTFSNGVVQSSIIVDEKMVNQEQKYGTKKQSAKLIVTLFARPRTVYGGPPHAPSTEKYILQTSFSNEIPSALEFDFKIRLASLVPSVPLVMFSTKLLSPHVLQIAYTTSSFDTHSIRRHPLISAFESIHSLEIVFDLFSNSTLSHRPIQLVIFDMDSTLINEEVIDEVARSIGVTPAVSAITARAMNGEIDFAQSLRARLALLKGVNTSIWKELEKSLLIAAGAKELCTELRSRGAITAIASGGFAPMAEWLKEQLGMDYAFANHVSFFPLKIKFLAFYFLNLLFSVNRIFKFKNCHHYHPRSLS